MIRSLFTICCFFVLLSLNAQVSVSAVLDNNKALIGDQINLHLEANYPSGSEVASVDLSVLDSIIAKADPSSPDTNPGVLEILQQSEWETLTNGSTTTYRKDIKLIAWKEGVYFIPPIRFIFKNGSNSRAEVSNQLTLLISSPIDTGETVDTTNIAPIKGILAEEWRFSDFLPLIYTIGAIVLIILAIVVLIIYIARRKQGPPPIQIAQRPAHEIALQKLQTLKAEEVWQKGNFKEYQSQLTYIIREYIENRYKKPALESTTGQILSDLKQVDFPDQLVEKMREMLQLADMVKFAKAVPPEATNIRLMEEAEDIVQSTKQKLSELEEEQLKAAGAGTQATFMLSTHYGHPGKRLLAYLIDNIMFQGTFSFIAFIIIKIVGRDEYGGLSLLAILLLIIVFIGYALFYYAYQHSRTGQTPGKKMMNLQLMRSDGQNISMLQASIRYFIKFISFFVLFLPMLPILFNKQKQALHDMVIDSVVIRKKSTK